MPNQIANTLDIKLFIMHQQKRAFGIFFGGGNAGWLCIPASKVPLPP